MGPARHMPRTSLPSDIVGKCPDRRCRDQLRSRYCLDQLYYFVVLRHIRDNPSKLLDLFGKSVYRQPNRAFLPPRSMTPEKS
ncbi:hypothetical protein HMPREF1705_04770 [Acetomicrobium hydrogeniformans ATCC BAA-1850]|uniref:Uncharacterized protein n=1 Tax=Acetomicrobium hydrogeniformans ATCC BAA-1850 TaxID=592015 RepID=A0A0T5XA35_9BACT|nr:hypothetical protein HMPREF1705_04770 [Acetomicrobium hydrogeniformans ATCC BAA-1850]